MLSSVLKLHIIVWNVTDISVEAIVSAVCLLITRLFLGLLFDLEHADDMFLRNVGWFSINYIALYPRRHKSSQ
jgi:hypothetical protein